MRVRAGELELSDAENDRALLMPNGGGSECAYALYVEALSIRTESVAEAPRS
ncbi:MAG: hypothetical protein ACXWJN_07635 [Methyloceanibacter sp.]